MGRKKRRQKKRTRSKVTISRGQRAVADTLRQMQYQVSCEYVIAGRSFDVCIHDINMIIEYNGTKWHLDPKFYDYDYKDHRNRYAREVWDKDKSKLDLAIKHGYEVRTIWQHDWNNISKGYRKNFLKRIIADERYLNRFL